MLHAGRQRRTAEISRLKNWKMNEMMRKEMPARASLWLLCVQEMSTSCTCARVGMIVQTPAKQTLAGVGEGGAGEMVIASARVWGVKASSLQRRLVMASARAVQYAGRTCRCRCQWSRPPKGPHTWTTW